jgi:lantibiotic modifying enzyme
MGQELPRALVEWIERQGLDPRQYPPGLYFGLSGMACALWDIGQHERALEAIRLAIRHPMGDEAFDWFHGKAGIGAACLKFYRVTKDQEYLEAACQVADQLKSTARLDAGRLFWSHRGEVPFGLGHGASGAAMFFVQLYQLTNDPDHLEVAKAALQFDLDGGLPNLDGGLSWPYKTGTRAPLLPYYRYGSAGVGMAVLRLLQATGEARYTDALEAIVLDTNRKYAVGTGLFLGLTGLGEFCLDAYDCLGESRFLEMAKRIASGLLLFAIPRDEGIAFPGERLLRISCDYGTGSAGVALFFQRLVTRKRSLIGMDDAFFAVHAHSAHPDVTSLQIGAAPHVP